MAAATVFLNIMWVGPRGADDFHRLPIGSYLEWKGFEGMLMECLSELGLRVTIPPRFESDPSAWAAADFAIHAHTTRRDLPGDHYYKQVHLRPLFTIDPLGWGADHSAMSQALDLDAIDAETATVFCGVMLDDFLRIGASKHAQPSPQEELEVPDDFIFVPIQLPLDYVNVHHSPVRVTEFVRRVCRWAIDARQSVVLKPHPGSTPNCDENLLAREMAESSPYVRYVTANVHSLVARSRGVFTINSGVGFESLIHGKPVATFGDCDYRSVTFSAGVDRFDEAREFLDAFTHDQRVRQQRFVYHYCINHAYSIERSRWSESKLRLRKYLSEYLIQTPGEPANGQMQSRKANR